MRKDPFPIDFDALMATVTELLRVQGDTAALSVLAQATITKELLDYDNWNGGTYTWALRCALDLRHYTSIKAQFSEISRSIEQAANTLFQDFENHSLQVLITAEPVANPNWRADAARAVSGRGATNQGRVRSDNPASIERDGLFFRSEREVNLYLALMKLHVTFAPLPVFLRKGFRRAEPDFVIVKRGLITVVEVDSTTYHKERPVEAQENRRLLEDEGARIIHVDAADCATLELADKCAARIMQRIETFLQQR